VEFTVHPVADYGRLYYCGNQYVLLMNGSESRGCPHSAFHRITSMHKQDEEL